MLAPDSAIAGKHTDISLKTKRIANAVLPECQVYIATYTAGRSGQSYQQIEQESGEEFWSIKARTPPPHRRLKDPDVLITRGKQAPFLVEIKWGALKNRTGSDLNIGVQEQEKIGRLLDGSVMCRVRGPAMIRGRRYRSSEFQFEHDYWTDDTTRLVLVSDFALMKEIAHQNFQDAVRLWKRASKDLLIADIDHRVGEIPSLEELLKKRLRKDY